MKPNGAKRFPLFFYPLSIFLGCVVGVLFLEGILQLMPVGNAVLRAEVDERYTIKRFKPLDVVRWSAGWNFSYRTVKRSNNLGYLNDHDCVRINNASTMTIIGDSYVEAMQVRNKDAHHALLHSGLQAQGQVCGIGTSGSPLSNYLIYAGLARNELAPEALAFVIVGNDFDESMCRYFNMGIGMWCFREIGDEQFELVPKEPQAFLARELGRYSALLRYISFNLSINWRNVLGKFTPKEEKAEYVGNVPTQVNAERLRYSQVSVDLFLKELPDRSGLSRDQLLFVVDGIRQDIYSGNPSGSRSFFGQMREYFIDSARTRGHEIIDLQPVFAHDYSIHREKFEYPIDGHWNDLGHYLVATAIAKSNVFAKAFGKEIQLGQRPRGLVY